MLYASDVLFGRLPVQVDDLLCLALPEKVAEHRACMRAFSYDREWMPPPSRWLPNLEGHSINHFDCRVTVSRDDCKFTVSDGVTQVTSQPFENNHAAKRAAVRSLFIMRIKGRTWKRQYYASRKQHRTKRPVKSLQEGEVEELLETLNALGMLLQETLRDFELYIVPEDNRGLGLGPEGSRCWIRKGSDDPIRLLKLLKVSYD